MAVPDFKNSWADFVQNWYTDRDRLVRGRATQLEATQLRPNAPGRLVTLLTAPSPVLTRQMERSMVGATQNSSTSRVSSSAWLEDPDDPVVMALNRRVEMATGMDVTNRTGYGQEMLQVRVRRTDRGPHTDPGWVEM